MTPFQIIFITLMFLIFLAVGGWMLFIYMRVKKLEGVTEDSPILLNLDKKSSHTLGLIIKEDVGRGGRSLIKYKKAGEDYPLISNHIIKLKDKLGEREVWINLPIHSENLVDDIKNSKLAYVFSKYIEETNLDSSVIKALREARDRQDVIRILQGGGELSNKFVRWLIEIGKQGDKLDGSTEEGESKK